MKIINLLFLIAALSMACNKADIVHEEIAIGISAISIESSSYKLPLNEYGVAVLTCRSNSGHDLTASSEFFVDDQKIESNVFKPAAIGTYKIHSRHKNLKSNPSELEVGEPLNKKVLIEFFTSRTCGFCPWIGLRLDSLKEANSKVVSYAIHGEDELEIDNTKDFQDYLEVYGRPSVRIERGYVRNYAAQNQINRLIDSLEYFLSVQPKIEISIETNLMDSNLDINVHSKFYEKIPEDIYLTLVMVEDSVMTRDQYNYFSGYPESINPFVSLPSLLPEYNNYNVLRNFLTDARGDVVEKEGVEYNTPIDIGSFQLTLDSNFDLKNMYIIAVVHKQRDDIQISSVINSQIVKVGEVVDFDE